MILTDNNKSILRSLAEKIAAIAGSRYIKKKQNFGPRLMIKKTRPAVWLRQEHVCISARSMPIYKLANMYRKTSLETAVLNFFKYGTKKLPYEKGIAFLWKDSNALHVLGCFEDSDVFNSATKKNEKTWQTGDVMEFFFQAHGQNDYYELHLTPEDATLELRIPSIEKFGNVPFESQFYESGFSSYAGRFNEPECQGWFGYMKIPFKGLGIIDDKLENRVFPCVVITTTKSGRKRSNLLLPYIWIEAFTSLDCGIK